jgi:hypothetical protein
MLPYSTLLYPTLLSSTLLKSPNEKRMVETSGCWQRWSPISLDLVARLDGSMDGWIMMEGGRDGWADVID